MKAVPMGTKIQYWPGGRERQCVLTGVVASKLARAGGVQTIIFDIGSMEWWSPEKIRIHIADRTQDVQP